ncbi:disease resistance protein At4g27190-like [Rhododendron vialii]|uniref:disease resistance protein At4g27190-like n=1 Tax=Rhododendron vialii TaxID=182163 RepID=UPI00265EB95F|nr:disease resistance protein At4g27190-like [Rhododendron vialii]
MNVVEKFVDKISEVATTIAFRHIGYVFQYTENVQNLEVETERLEGMRGRINERAESDRRNAQVIKPDVEKWLKDAKEMQDEVAAFLANKERSNTRCVKCRCPNLKWRYRLGKESELKTFRITSLKEQGTMFLTVLPISHPAPPPESPLTNDGDFDSRQEIFNKILEAIKDPIINMIGVHGAGGVGKTRMVNEVRNQAKRDGLFNDVAFAVVSRNLDKKNVQGELAAQLGLTLEDYGRAEKLLTRLQKGKNLVILDDIWDPLDLKEIGIPTTTDHGNNEGGCKVLVTSRKNLFHMITPKARNKEFFVPVLEKKEARILFMKTAEISVNSHEDMPSEAKEVCDECGGLPVAILAVAKALKGKGSYAWKDALRQLKSSNFNKILDIDPKLFPSLKLSYDLLELEDARSCFLLCSLFPEDAEISIDDLVRYSFGMRLLDPTLSTTLEDVRNRVLTVVEGLKASCLLLDGKDNNTVKMHDVIRDVAISVAKDEKRYLVKHDLKKWPERVTYEHYSAISLMSEYFCEIPRELGCKELRTLVLRSKDSSLPDSFFNGMETNLEVLDLSGTAIESLPISLSKLVKLRMLFLPGGIRNISLLGKLKSLEILCFDGIYELAPEIRQLTCLKLLDLGNNEDVELRVIPPNVLSNLTRMEELCIPDDFAEWQDEATNEERKNASLVELNSFTCLTTLKVHMPRGKSSPNNLYFENLVRFRISIGKQKFYRIQKEESSTSILKLSSVPLEDKFKVLLMKSKVLYLHEVTCDGGEDHLGTPEQFLQTPQPSISRPFCNLSTLDVQNCTFKYLFNLSVARRLEQLQRLDVGHCSNMEVIVGNETRGEDEEITFPRLKAIQLRNIPNLKSFCPSKRPNSITGDSNSDPAQPLFCEKVVVPVLEELEISDLDNISELWDKQFKPIMKEGTRSFSQLRSLEVNQCPRLVNVVPSNIVPRLTNLKSLHVSNCDLVVHEIEDLITAGFPSLERLDLWDLQNLRETGLNKKEDSLRGINVVYPNIKYIFISNCPNLESIFSASTARNLAHLRSLRIDNFPNSDSKLKAIVETPKERDGASDEPFVFPELYYMQLEDLQSFCNSYGPEESLFNQKVVFPCLQYLDVSRFIGNVKGIWDRTPPADSFQKLTYLELDKCHSLLYVAPSELLLGSLQNLENLTIRSCELLEEVFKNRVSDSGEGIVSKHEPTTEEVDTNVVLPRLRYVILYELPRLKSFCSGSKLPSSAEREISNCPLLETPF